MEETKFEKKEENIGQNEDLILFDKNYFLVAAGVLTFTVTFIKDIVDIGSASWIICLFISWILLGLALAIIIISFYISASLAEHNRIDRDSIDREYLLAWKYAPRGISIGAFLLGLLFLCLFIGRNFYLKNEPSKKNSTETGNDILNKKIDSIILKKIDSTIIRIKPDTIFFKMTDRVLDGG